MKITVEMKSDGTDFPKFVLPGLPSFVDELTQSLRRRLELRPEDIIEVWLDDELYSMDVAVRIKNGE